MDAGNVDDVLAQWRVAADAGDRRAMLALGRLHVQGLGVSQSYVEAHMWFNLAASRGEMAAVGERDALAARMTPGQIATAQECAMEWRPGGGRAESPAAPVGSFPANGFGLHDVHGNVWEWVEDCWHGHYKGAPSDGSAWTSGGDCSKRVLRGGSWNNNPRNLRSANRNRNTTGNRNDNNGFRVARTLDGPSRRPHGAAGRATERPGTVMTSEVPAPLLPRSGGGGAPVFVPAQDGHRR